MIKIHVGKYFDIHQIAISGQCFRMTRVMGKKNTFTYGYRTIYKDHYIEVYQNAGEEYIYVTCSEEIFNKVWAEYFDLTTDYNDYATRLKNMNDTYINMAFEYGSGIRILRQDKFEMLISYIISQQKRIPNIMETVENLSKKYGRKLSDEFTGVTFYSFPDAETILAGGLDGLGDLKLGYRDKYIIDACQKVKKQGIEWFSGPNAYDRALEIKGVGAKVANCYTLFGCHDLTRFPVDTWIKKILAREYPGGLYLPGCRDFAGLIQQYMFYYERNTAI